MKQILFNECRWQMDSSGTWLCLRVDRADAVSVCTDMVEGKTYEATIKVHRKRRSLDANAYAWTLIDKLAAAVNLPKEEVYRRAIKQIGGVSDTMCVQNKAVETLCNGWHRHGLGWLTELYPSKIAGCTNVVLYYGSSVYDQAQMSRLIQNIKGDCDSLGIPTKTPDEIAKLVSLWGEADAR